MSRRVYLMGVGMALVAGAFLLTDALLWRPGVTKANVMRLREGMTREEVTSILGDSDPPVPLCVNKNGRLVVIPTPVLEVQAAGWSSDWYVISVIFRKGRVVEISAVWGPEPEDVGPLTRLRAWLGL